VAQDRGALQGAPQTGVMLAAMSGAKATTAQDDLPLLRVQQDSVVTLTLNRPALRNPVTDPDMLAALLDAIEAIGRDRSVRCVILTGAGQSFCSGGNIRAMAGPEGRAASPAHVNRDWYGDGIQRLPLAFSELEVPVIAAVNGAAMGVGCDLACMCDMRIASTAAIFAESFVKMGLVPGDGGSWLLPRIVGQARAREMIFTGDPLSAQEALAAGLVSRVVAPEDLMPTAQALAARVAANPPIAVRMAKRLLRESERSDLATVLQLSAGMQCVAHATEDHLEAVQAFLEKRPARFVGR